MMHDRTKGAAQVFEHSSNEPLGGERQISEYLIVFYYAVTPVMKYQ